ncbi:MAG: DegT/DnrJ/EryC1/StrS aminotransferase family protein [Gammaproteobacteria bacterium]
MGTWPHFEEDEINAVTDVLSSGKVNYWTGKECHLFEQEFAKFIGSKYAISLANGTVALELALHALGIGVGDDVIVPARTFIASASCVIARGAGPVVADIDPISQNITAETIEQVLTPKTKAIIVVHLAGWPCDMDSILQFAAKHKLKVIEDCAQAHGAEYRGKRVGSFGDAAAFSFCQDKIMTTGGEGGMLLTNDEEIWRRAWAYKDHGKNPNKACADIKQAGFRWVHESFGTNFRMTEMQAAIGRLQLRKLPAWLETRERNAKLFCSKLRNIAAFDCTDPPSHIKHAYYKYYVFIKPKLLKPNWDRNRIVEEINARGVPCGCGSCGEIYLEKAFVDMGLQPKERFPNAKKLSESSLMFLVHPTLQEEDILRMCAVICEVLKEAQAI